MNFNFMKNSKKLDISREFIEYESQGIIGYTLCFNKDLKKGINLLSILIQNIYGIDKEDDFEIELYDQGSLY